MAGKTNTRRWILVALVAFGVVLVATLPWGGTDDAEPVEGGLATRRVIEGCDPVVEAMKYEELVDRRALAVLRWSNMGERAANLKIPVYVKSVGGGAVGLSILEIPMREQYIGVWMNSGHIEAGEDGAFRLDPCSARIEPWEEMERLTGGTGSD